MYWRIIFEAYEDKLNIELTFSLFTDFIQRSRLSPSTAAREDHWWSFGAVVIDIIQEWLDDRDATLKPTLLTNEAWGWHPFLDVYQRTEMQIQST